MQPGRSFFFSSLSSTVFLFIIKRHRILYAPVNFMAAKPQLLLNIPKILLSYYSDDWSACQAQGIAFFCTPFC